MENLNQEGQNHPRDVRVPSWVSTHKWYHEIDLGNGIVINAGKGQPNLIPIFALLDKLDLTGRVCLDIGTWDGKIAFEMERRGAAQVVATDYVEDRETFHLLHQYFSSKVEYVPGVHIDDLARAVANKGPFDFILLSGVLYHIFNPLLALANARCLMKPGGLIIVETACLDRPDVAMHFNQDGRFYADYSTLWVMSVQCLQYLLSLCCFRPLQESTYVSPLWGRKGVVRHTILARAVKPSEMAQVDDWLYRCTLASEGKPTSSLAFRPLDYTELEAQDYDTADVIACVDELAGRPLAPVNKVKIPETDDSVVGKLVRKSLYFVARLAGHLE